MKESHALLRIDRVMPSREGARELSATHANGGSSLSNRGSARQRTAIFLKVHLQRDAACRSIYASRH